MDRKPGKHQKIYTISGQGYSATCDAFAVHPQTEHIWFASMVGSLRAVRAISANLCSQPPSKIFLNSDDPMDHYRSFSPDLSHPVGWEHREQKLPNTQLHHAMVYNIRAKYENKSASFMILCHDPQEAPERHYRFLDERVTMPLHPSWADWLWETGTTGESIIKLESHGINAYLCTANEQRMIEQISEAIRKGDLVTP